MPPNPKEFDNTLVTLRFFAVRGTKSKPIVPLSGLIKLLVGGTVWLTIDRTEYIERFSFKIFDEFCKNWCYPKSYNNNFYKLEIGNNCPTDIKYILDKIRIK